MVPERTWKLSHVVTQHGRYTHDCVLQLGQRWDNERSPTPEPDCLPAPYSTDMATHDPMVAGLRSTASDNSQDTIFSEVLATSFKKYYDAYQKIKPESGLLVELPRIVVFGERNAGKSSLLENITKHSIFPRENNLCTKVPITLKLKQVSTAEERSCSVKHKGELLKGPGPAEDRDILQIIRGIMDSTDGLKNDGIEVEISEVSD